MNFCLECSRLEFRHVYNFHSVLRHINRLENSPHRVKCHKIVMIYPQPIRRLYHPNIHINYACSYQLTPWLSGQSSATASHRRRFDSCRRTLQLMIISQLFPVRISTCGYSQNRKLTRRFTQYKLRVTLYTIWRARFSSLNKCIVIFHLPD